MHQAELRRCLEQLDCAGTRKLWQHVSPHLPQPKSDAETLIALHHARTQAKSIQFKHRAYSHRWLCDNGYPSGLPDPLKPSAERIYPKIVKAVGIAVVALSASRKPAAALIERAMADAVEDAYAEGKQDDDAFVTARMHEAREKTKKLLGV